ncbi:hypothetical protein HL667_11165 [Bradyrhizobium sp. 83012]|uniref:Uncharacterized protein n=2 Tax=Nitrobacteraceae TaxID=41294 RepID=A0ABX2CBH1_9BRAD|nr:hypothetical protein [Bradyrhizobium aeschynomenes]NPU65554.1 hypothetical protein [Bradyrhizobium aeschynomenes]NPV23424.1 hypothetical protein [Bradyrhizobium aeschynomenes]
MLMRTPAREKPGLGERVRRVIERLRDHASSLTSSSPANGATVRKPSYHFVDDEPDDSNMDVALAALIDQIEHPARTPPPRFPGLARVTSSRQAPHIPVYERPPYFDVEPRQLEPRPLEVEPRRMPHDEPAERIVPEDELSELRKDLMSAISSRLGSPEDHLATIRTLLRSVK